MRRQAWWGRWRRTRWTSCGGACRCVLLKSVKKKNKHRRMFFTTWRRAPITHFRQASMSQHVGNGAVSGNCWGKTGNDLTVLYCWVQVQALQSAALRGPQMRNTWHGLRSIAAAQVSSLLRTDSCGALAYLSCSPVSRPQVFCVRKLPLSQLTAQLHIYLGTKYCDGSAEE